jgi:hypothetical protein
VLRLRQGGGGRPHTMRIFYEAMEKNIFLGRCADHVAASEAIRECRHKAAHTDQKMKIHLAGQRET